MTEKLLTGMLSPNTNKQTRHVSYSETSLLTGQPHYDATVLPYDATIGVHNNRNVGHVSHRATLIT